MRFIRLEKTLPDGRVALLHRVLELVMQAGSDAKAVVIGSWVDAADAARTLRPDATSRVDLPDETDETRDIQLIDRLFALPGWRDGELLDVQSR